MFGQTSVLARRLTPRFPPAASPPPRTLPAWPFGRWGETPARPCLPLHLSPLSPRPPPHHQAAQPSDHHHTDADIVLYPTGPFRRRRLAGNDGTELGAGTNGGDPDGGRVGGSHDGVWDVGVPPARGGRQLHCQVAQNILATVARVPGSPNEDCLPGHTA